MAQTGLDSHGNVGTIQARCVRCHGCALVRSWCNSYSGGHGAGNVVLGVA